MQTQGRRREQGANIGRILEEKLKLKENMRKRIGGEDSRRLK